jgi:hypothetical protein
MLKTQEHERMRSGRYGVTIVTLSLAALALLIPPARADDGSEAALRQQLEEVHRQLNELQLKLERIDAEHSAAPAMPVTPVTAPAAAAPPSAKLSPVPVGNATAPTPVPVGTPVTVVPATSTPPPPAPLRVEAARPQATPVVPDAFQWREALKEQWGSVRIGMADEQIRQLLGKPSREFTLDGKPVWYYTYPGIGSGSVLFSRDGHTVAGWQHPPFGLFW